jgi:hypothetical protein
MGWLSDLVDWAGGSDEPEEGMLTTKQRSVVDSLAKAGFKMEDIPALMGNIEKETWGTFDYTKKEVAKGKSGYGLFQFTDKHKDAYFDWLDKGGLSDSSDSQAKFVYDNVYNKQADVPYDVGSGNMAKVRFAFESDSLPYKTFMFGKRYEQFEDSEDVGKSKANYEERINSAKKWQGLLSSSLN